MIHSIKGIARHGRVGVLTLLCCLGSAAMADQQFEIPASDFLVRVFEGEPPAPSVIWLTGPTRDEVRNILGHNYASLRVRYWKRGPRTAWILDEIGKERPITAGFFVNEGKLEQTAVLAFRESRGWEIRHDVFTRQFDGAGLLAMNQLDTGIDGISGATLSVSAMRRMSIMALYLTTQLPETKD